MGATQAPFMYQAVHKDDDRFPGVSFDPKAVTRASYEPKKPKPKPDGPLVSFNRHPDAHMVPGGRSAYKPMSRRTKGWIKGMRVVQLSLRVVEIIAAIGLIAVMCVVRLIGWIIGVTLGVVILHCVYSVFHHARPAGSRSPGSSAAYQVFSGISDLCVLPLYAYGAFTTRNKLQEWKADPGAADADSINYMAPSVYYGLIGAGGLHVLSLSIALWLAVMFRRISNMPPDMNPLEANLTSRVHKRNKSSVATTSTAYSDEKRESQLYDESAPPRSVAFMHTRQGSDTSSVSRDSRLNLPSRQYQVVPGNRSSATSQDLKRMSAPPSAHRTSYIEVPLGETDAGVRGSPSRPTSMYASRPSTGTVPSYRAEPVSPAQTIQPRSAKFTETWYASESLISRTQQRNRASNSSTNSPRQQQQQQRTTAVYTTLDASSDSDSEAENFYTPSRPTTTTATETSPNHPNPLRSNPTTTENTTTTTPKPRRPRTPFSRLRNSTTILSTLSPNDRRVSGNGSGDITDYKGATTNTAELGIRKSSIQPDSEFLSAYSKPYGELKAATPPILVGGVTGPGARVVSSGNDWDSGNNGGGDLGRRNVSGRAAEEGRAGGRWRRSLRG